MGVVRLADFTGNLDRHESGQSGEGPSSQFGALQRALIGGRLDGGSSPVECELGPSNAIDQLREVASYLRASDGRIADLESGLDAIRERARRNVRAAQERSEQAEARVSAEAARADAAEVRAREAEERLGQIMAVIEQEFAAGRAAHG
jgi:hypothetical protein